MTEDEIIKALECCDFVDIKACEECPLYRSFDCRFIIIDKSLDLINRQKAEIERLKSYKKTSHYWYKKCNELVYELQTTKSEAIKEFAERLKYRAYKTRIKNMETEKVLYYMDEFKLDNLVKEMTEGQDDGSNKRRIDKNDVQ